jgi:hypothetical protein
MDRKRVGGESLKIPEIEYVKIPIVPDDYYPSHFIMIEKWIAQRGGYADRADCHVQVEDYNKRSYRIVIVDDNSILPHERHFVAKSRSYIVKSVTTGELLTLEAFL